MFAGILRANFCFRLLNNLIVNVDLYSASTQTPLTRSNMDHTVLPADNTISAFKVMNSVIGLLKYYEMLKTMVFNILKYFNMDTLFKINCLTNV